MVSIEVTTLSGSSSKSKVLPVFIQALSFQLLYRQILAFKDIAAAKPHHLRLFLRTDFSHGDPFPKLIDRSLKGRESMEDGSHSEQQSPWIS